MQEAQEILNMSWKDYKKLFDNTSFVAANGIQFDENRSGNHEPLKCCNEEVKNKNAPLCVTTDSIRIKRGI